MKHSETTNYDRKEIDRKIVSLAWPAILSNITVPLLGLSDTFISGHLGNDLYLAAIVVATTMVNSLYWIFGFLRMGTTGLTATAYGAGDDMTQARVFTRALVTAATAGFLLSLLSPVSGVAILHLMSPPAEVADAALDYFVINMLGAPALLVTNVIYGRLTGRQNTLYPMIIAISVNVLNIILSVTLVFMCGMGFKGVAIGTTAANWIGMILGLYLAHRQSRGQRMLTSLRDMRGGGDLRRFFKVNSFLVARSVCMMIVTFAMTYYASSLGTRALAINAVMMQFFIFFSYFMDGFAYSGEALCGRYYGAADLAHLRLTIKRLTAFGLMTAGIFALTYGVFSPTISWWISESEAVTSGIRGLRVICILLPVASVTAFIFDGIYIGITKTYDMMLSTMGGMILFFAIYAGLSQTAICTERLILLWIAFLSFLTARGVILGIRLKSLKV